MENILSMLSGGITMKSDNRNESHISWCLRQKRGISLVQLNENLCTAYLAKAKSALNMLSASLEKEEVEWIATTAYYARYFAFYALLQRCGISSEIHDCTLSLLKEVFVKEKIIDPTLHAELSDAKDMRTDVQYYVAQELDKEKVKASAKTAWTFVLKMEEVIENIKDEDIKKVRDNIMCNNPKSKK